MYRASKHRAPQGKSAPTAWKVLSSQFKAITDDNVCVIHWAIVWPEAKWRRFSQDSIVTILIFRERVLGYVSQGAEPVWDIIARQLQKSWMRWQYFQKLGDKAIFSKVGWRDNIFLTLSFATAGSAFARLIFRFLNSLPYLPLTPGCVLHKYDQLGCPSKFFPNF